MRFMRRYKEKYDVQDDPSYKKWKSLMGSIITQSQPLSLPVPVQKLRSIHDLNSFAKILKVERGEEDKCLFPFLD